MPLNLLKLWLAMIAAKEMRARGLADPHRNRRSHLVRICAAADAVGAEKFASHAFAGCLLLHNSAMAPAAQDGIEKRYHEMGTDGHQTPRRDRRNSL